MAETFVSWVVDKLADAAVEEFLHLYSVNEQVEKVREELIPIKAFLKDADRKQLDERQKEWVKDVRDIAYRIEDVIDIFLLEIPQNPQKSCLCETIKNMLRNPKNLPAVHNLVNEMKQILEKMNKIEERRVRYGINNLGEGSGDITLPIRPLILPDIDPDIVGFKADQDRIVKKLLDKTTKRRSVVSICGIGGLGKTTLAQKVYNCGDVIKQFEVRIWVAISEKFKVIDVSEKIGQQLKLAEQSNAAEVILADIHKSLRGKKYLIVLDDVWPTNLWTQIGAAFPDDNNGSRVLVTTRFADVPKEMDTISESHMLQCLTDELSRELLLKTVFPNLDPNKSSFDDLSDIIGKFVHKCGGLPLALVVLGGLLLKKPRTYAAWSSVYHTSWNDVEGINPHKIIGTSYQDLPFALKSCFMYFAAFPEDYDIDVKSLLQMWVAEGFIPQENNRTLEETAESFLEDLVQRSMVQVHFRSDRGSIHTLRIHDLLRDLALQKAKEENFLLVYSNPDNKMSLSKARRVAIHHPDCDELIMSPNLRTLLCFHNGSMPNCSKQRLLKVVSKKGYLNENKIEFGLFEGLTQLRYLSLEGGLSDNFDEELFEKVVSRMEFLQTLRVLILKPNSNWYSHDSYFMFPKSAWNIKTLRHVYNNNFELPASVELPNLQTISGGVRATRSWQIDQLPHVPNLRSLELNVTSNASITFLSTLEHLTDLEISQYGDNVWIIFGMGDSALNILDMRGFRFYNHLQSLSLQWHTLTQLSHQLLHEDMLPCHLTYLHIDGYKFQQDIMPVLEKLQWLKVLILDGSFESKKTTCSSGGFRELEKLSFINLSSMEEWEIEEGAMPHLKKLLIRECDKLDVPHGLQYLTNLQILSWLIRRGGGGSKANLVRNLCQHVPSIYLREY